MIKGQDFLGTFITTI